MAGQFTTGDRIAAFGEAARARMRPAFIAAGVEYPPGAVTLVALKSARTLRVFAGPSTDALKPIVTYPVLGQSGELGPKLREGDRQVPEGIYRIEGLNPNSGFYVSLRLNYPNDFDLRMAAADGRTEPGSDIYIHGGTASIGCLAMGDPVIEELFTLAVDVGVENMQVIIAPDELRAQDVKVEGAPPWVGELYEQIRVELRGLPTPGP
jgi:murein L,D-transpeptidase YafK